MGLFDGMKKIKETIEDLKFRIQIMEKKVENLENKQIPHITLEPPKKFVLIDEEK